MTSRTELKGNRFMTANQLNDYRRSEPTMGQAADCVRFARKERNETEI
jgi:hypothetical protein